jgi:hypothetical protein
MKNKWKLVWLKVWTKDKGNVDKLRLVDLTDCLRWLMQEKGLEE